MDNIKKFGPYIAGALALIALFAGKDFLCKPSPGTNPADSTAQAWSQKYHELEEKYHLAIAQAQGTTDPAVIQAFQERMRIDEQHRQTITRILDSLQKENYDLRQLAFGTGHVTVTGGGLAASESTYSDAWQDIDVSISGNKLKSLEYSFSFNVSDVRATVEQANGKQAEVYDVFITSTKDSTKTLYIGDYRRSLIDEIPVYSPINWWNPRLNLTANVGGRTAEVAGTISLCTFGTSALSKGTILLFPDIGISSNAHDQTNVVGGLRFNIAHYIPLFTDLHLAAYLGVPTNEFTLQHAVLRVGVGTSL